MTHLVHHVSGELWTSFSTS